VVSCSPGNARAHYQDKFARKGRRWGETRTERRRLELLLRALFCAFSLFLLTPQFRLALLYHPSTGVADLFGFLSMLLLFGRLRRLGFLVCSFRFLELLKHGLSFLIKIGIALFASLLDAELGVQGHPPQRVEQKFMSLRKLMEKTRYN
jgi:hypothetical protein